MENQFEHIEKLLKGDHCIVHINPACPGTILPESFMRNPNVSLKISYYFAGSMTVSEKEIVAVLLFNGAPFTCTIPMDAIWAVTSEYGAHMTWDAKAPHPTFPAMLKKDQKEVHEPIQSTASNDKQISKSTRDLKKERPSFLKRVK